MPKYKFTIAYDGTNYSGWQVQPNASSIQETIEQIFKIILRQQVRVIGSGRTDAGVHALGQVAHFESIEGISTRRFLLSANALLLPSDIRILSLEEVSDDFHAQYSTTGKEYHYHLSIGPAQDPFRRFYCFHLHYNLDLGLLKAATQLFLGKHDFTTFANSAHHGSASRNPVRTIKRLDVIEEKNNFLRLEFEADGFLYKMVRNITGTVLDVAAGRLSLEQINFLFDAKDRRKAPQAAPSQGLFLVRVYY